MASKFGRPPPKSAFKPGQPSANPAGRPAKRRDVEALARECTSEAIAALRAALKVPRERVAAAQVLLDRGWGRPRQQVQLGGEAGITLMRIEIHDPQGETVTIDAAQPAASETVALTFDGASEEDAPS